MKSGYYIDRERKCRFSMDGGSPGYRGLAWAILLKAIEDGCSQDWLIDICDYYDLDVDPSVFDQKPANKIKFNKDSKQMIGIYCNHESPNKRPLLELQDGLHIRGLAHLATHD